jgi:hypothetical protein
MRSSVVPGATTVGAEAVRNDLVTGSNGGLFAGAPESTLRSESALSRYQGNQPPRPSQSPATVILNNVTGTPLRA